MRRKLFDRLKKHLSKKEFSIITGARQTGKSTLMKQLETFCKQSDMPTIFLNLENKNLLTDLDSNALNLLNYLPDTDKKKIVFIDEVQYLADPSNLLKLIYDEYSASIKIVATGSSAFYIDDKFNDSLAGRKKIFQLFTCSFDEYLELQDKTELLAELNRIITKPNAKSTKISLLKNEWDNYMLYGGYPAVITENDKAEKVSRLDEIRDSFVKRDILESGVSNELAFYQLFQIIAGQGGLLNINELSGTLRIKGETVAHYLHVMQKCFHISLVRPFYRNLRKELVKMPKAYLLDTGLRNSLLNNFQTPDSRTDKGELWENMFFKLLVEKNGLEEVKYWRTADGNEVDFVMSDIENPYAIEVKYDHVAVKPSKYKKFVEAYPEMPLSFAWLRPFDEDFFRRIPAIGK